MNKGLILSYYFPPANSVPTPRLYSFAKYFKNAGIYPTIITRHWTGEEKFWPDFITDNYTQQTKDVYNDYTVYRLPYYSDHNALTGKLKKTPLLSNVYFFMQALSGHFTLEANARMCFKAFLQKHLKDNKYDFLLVSAPPLNIVRLGYEIAEEFNMPLIIDFRDIWNNYKLQENYNPTAKTKFFLNRQEYHVAKWMKNATLIATVSGALESEIRKFYKGKTIIISNGFEKEIFESFPERPSNKKFTFSIVGTIYKQQDISLLIKGLKKFIDDEKKQNIQLNFIGVGAISSVEQEIKESLSGFPLLITEKIKRETALEFMKNSDVLFYPAWRGYKGIISAKIFEYIASKRKVMIAPGDNDVIDALVKETQTGSIAFTTTEFTEQLDEFYTEWKQKGYVSHKPLTDKINQYTRQKQAEIFASKILDLLQ